MTKELPFLALPDGAHLSEEDYSYFVHFFFPYLAHLYPSPLALCANGILQHCTFSPSNDHSQQHNAETNIPTNQTLFGISYVISFFSLHLPSLYLSFSIISLFKSSDIGFSSPPFQFNLLGAIASSPPPSSTIAHQTLPGAWSKKPSSSLPVTLSLYVHSLLPTSTGPPQTKLTAPTGRDKRQTRRRYSRLLRPTRFRRNYDLGRLLHLS